MILFLRVIYMKNNFDAVIFDFDGTVADTGKGVFRCIRKSVKKSGLPELSEGSLRTFIGPPLHDSFMRECHVDFDTADILVKQFREVYSVSGVFEFDIYDGIEELLSLLNKEGVKVGIGSSKPQDFVHIILQKVDLEKYFDSIVGSDPKTVESTKTEIISKCIDSFNLPKNAKILMIGDRKFDIDGAHSVGIPCAAVLYGYGSEEEFKKHNADYIAKSTEELKQIIFS